MARLIRTTIAAYYEIYCSRQFAENHNCYLDGYDSQVVTVEQGRFPKLYRISFSDRTQTIVAHTAIVFVERVPGTLRNW
jgi:hypothetical protein